jgi:hypothetical protein
VSRHKLSIRAERLLADVRQAERQCLFYTPKDARRDRDFRSAAASYEDFGDALQRFLEDHGQVLRNAESLEILAEAEEPVFA